MKDNIKAFKKRLLARGVVATEPMIKAVVANGGKWNLERYRNTFVGGWSVFVERYPVEHWTELSDTGHFSAMDWHYHGVEDCKKGLPSQSDNENYLKGYAYQYELEAKQSAMCLH